jgi:hypothetical protein
MLYSINAKKIGNWQVLYSFFALLSALFSILGELKGTISGELEGTILGELEGT